MPQIVEAYFAEIILVQHQTEVLRHKVRTDQLSNGVKVNVFQILRAVAFSADAALFGLLLLNPKQYLSERRH